MVREVEVDLVANDKSDKGLESMARKFEAEQAKLTRLQKREIDKRGRDTKDGHDKDLAGLSKSLSGATKLVEGVNRQLTSLSLNEIDIKANPRSAVKAIEETQAKLKVLASDATTVEVKIRTERALGDLARLRKKIGDVGPEAATSFATRFGQKLGPAVEKLAIGPLSGQVVAGLAGLAVVASPLIGATIAGAIIGGVGIGGVVGGVYAASKDARVASAIGALSQNFQTKLSDAGGYFVQPTLDGIDRIQQSIDRIDLSGIFKDASTFVGPLAAGIGDALERLGIGIKAVIGGAGPVIGQISQEIGALGDIIGRGLASLADNGPQAASALQLVFGVINSSIQSVFTVVNGLTEIYGVLDRLHLLDGAHLFADLAEAGKNGTQWIDPAAQKLTILQQAAAKAVAPLQSLSAQINDLASAGQSLYSSTTQVGAAVARLSASIKENGRSLDASSAKGRANREALSGVASALSANYQAFVKVNGEGRAANSVAGQNRAAFIKAAEGFHIGQAAAEKLASQLGLIPAKKATSFTANTHDAAARVAALQGQINALRGKTVTVTVRTITTGGQHVSGGSTGSGGTQVKNAAAAMWSASGGGGGTYRTGGPTQVNSSLDLSVNLDGRPFRQLTRQIVSDSDRRNDYKRRVGPR